MSNAAPDYHSSKGMRLPVPKGHGPAGVTPGVVWLLVTAALVFLADAAGVTEHATGPVDRGVELAVHSDLPGALHTPIAFASTALGPSAVTALAVTAALLFALRRELSAAFLVVASPLGASMLENVLKTLIGRHRPHLWPGAQVLHSYSFPSGHATDAAALFAALCFLAWSRWDSRRSIAATALSCLLVLAVGVSRIYLGVHWPTDVIGGFSLALCWVSLLVVLLSVRSARWTSR